MNDKMGGQRMKTHKNHHQGGNLYRKRAFHYVNFPFYVC
nr:MAG TPA: Homoserine O-acetyltransferase [Caudoviricetes sp.]